MSKPNNKNQTFLSETSKVCLFDYDEYGVWVPPVTIIFLTYATSSIKTVWSGGDERVFLSSLIKKSRLKKKNVTYLKNIELSHSCRSP